MLPVALLVGLDAAQSEACRSALGVRARIIAVVEAEDAVMMLSLHRPKLVVMRSDLHHHQRRIISDLTARLGGRLASVAAEASPANVEHLIEGFAAVSFSQPEPEQRVESGTRRRVKPGEYHLASPSLEVVRSKKR